MTTSTETTVVVVAPEHGRMRLDRFLAQRRDYGTRSQVQRRIERREVQVNDKEAKAGTVVRAGDIVRVAAPASVGPQDVEPEDIALQVLYEDEDLLAIDKPAGMVVHPAPGHWQGTLVSALLHRWQGRRPGLDEMRPGIVHRLDRDTSGVLLIAKTPEAVAQLGAQFRGRKVRKEYLAIVWGRPRARRGTIDAPIGRHRTQRKKMAVRSGGRAAVTRYEVVAELGELSLLRVSPTTGRTHQIRVHLAGIGHAIAADPVYGRGRGDRGDAEVLGGLRRQALHAAAIDVVHPRTGEPLSIRAPLPDDMRQVLESRRGPPSKPRERRGGRDKSRDIA